MHIPSSSINVIIMKDKVVISLIPDYCRNTIIQLEQKQTGERFNCCGTIKGNYVIIIEFVID